MLAKFEANRMVQNVPNFEFLEIRAWTRMCHGLSIAFYAQFIRTILVLIRISAYNAQNTK